MYRIKIISAAQKDLESLPPQVFKSLKDKILRLSGNPRPHGCQKLTNEGGYRLRAGDYRVLYRIDDAAKEVFIYRAKHRKDVYR